MRDRVTRQAIKATCRYRILAAANFCRLVVEAELQESWILTATVFFSLPLRQRCCIFPKLGPSPPHLGPVGLSALPLTPGINKNLHVSSRHLALNAAGAAMSR